MSYQSLLQQVDDDQRWGGNGSGSGSSWSTRGSTHGSDRLKPPEGSSLVQEVDGGSSRSAGGGSGGGGGVYRGSFAAPLAMLNTGNRSGYGCDLTLFSPSNLFSSSPQQPLQQASASSPFSWQSLLGGQPSARWQPDAALHGYSTFGGGQAGVEPASEVNVAYAQGERNVRPRGGGGQNEQCVAHEDDGVTSEVDADRSGEAKEEWTNNVNSEENWRKFGDFIVGDVKQEESENIQAGHKPRDGSQSRKRNRQSRLQDHPEVIVNFEPSGSTSQSDSDSDEESGKQYKKEAISRKLKRPGQDADGNITWTDDSVKFLFQTYDAIHQRLWEQSKGQVKYKKKWTPILKAMQAKFGNHFTKKQCQSKYWSVRRECTEYRFTSAKAAATDPLWNPSIAGRELLKPRFYDVWLEVSGKNQAIVTKRKSSTVKGEGYSGELHKGESSRFVDKDGQPVRQRLKDSSSAMKEMQRLMLVQLQASEKREEAMKYRAELMMELLTQHIEHVENRVSHIDESRTPQLYLLERVNHKLDKLFEGFAALDQNLSMLQ